MCRSVIGIVNTRDKAEMIVTDLARLALTHDASYRTRPVRARLALRDHAPLQTPARIE